jgi:DNA modification methylase
MIREVERGDGWTLVNGDSCEELPLLEPESVDFSVYSPPFLSLYTYTASERDIGNCTSHAEFLDHMRYVITGLLKATKPGRLTAVHIADVVTQKQKDGVIGLQDLPGMIIQAYIGAGWIYHGRIAVDKDPQAQAIRTKSKALLFVQLRKDASWLRPALADYVCVFRAPGENTVPILPDISNEDWIQWARPIWYGVRETNTLNTMVAKANDDERHICPLQLDLIERCIRLWSNPGELVVSPFAGIGSEGYEAIRLGRRFFGVELKPQYYTVACRNLREAEHMRTQGELFRVASPA